MLIRARSGRLVGLRRMIAVSVASLAVGFGSQAFAATMPVRLEIDGRPLTHATAVARDGVVYVELGSIVRSFSGLVVFQGPTATVSIGPRVAIFTLGSTRANLDGKLVPMSGKTFELDGDRYVPLGFIATRVASADLHMRSSGAIASLTTHVTLPTPTPGIGATP